MISPRGFTLLISVVLASVVLAIGLALLDIAYKQVILSSSARNSQYAFYAADAALECALYYDQQLGHFAFDPPPVAGTLPSISCQGQTGISVTQTGDTSTTTATFSIPCPSGGSKSTAQVTKGSGGYTAIYTYGYNTCSAADQRRIERGLKVLY